MQTSAIDQPTRDLIAAIITKVAGAWGVEPESLLMQTREEPIVTARHMAIGIISDNMPWIGTAVLGSIFKRDRSSILWARNRHRDRLETCPIYQGRHKFSTTLTPSKP